MSYCFILFYILFVHCFSHECIVISNLQDVDLSNPNVYIQSDDFQCPQELVNYTLTLNSLTPVTLHHFPPIAFLKINSQTSVTIVDPFSSFLLHFNSSEQITIESFIGHFECNSCTLDLITGHLLSPILPKLKISGYVTLLSTHKLHFPEITNAGSLSIITPLPPQIDLYKGNDYTTLLTPSSIYSPSSGVVSSRNILTLLHPYQNVIISSTINHVFISSAKATIDTSLTFQSIFLLNGEITISAPITVTLFSANNSRIIINNGQIRSFSLLLTQSKIDINKPIETVFISHNSFVDSVEIHPKYESTSQFHKIIECNTEIKMTNAGNLEFVADNKVAIVSKEKPMVTAFKKCHVIANGQKDLFLDGTKIKYREEYCPCADCDFVIDEPSPVIIHFEYSKIGGIHCVNECFIKPKQAPTIKLLKGKRVTVQSDAIVLLLIPVDNGIIIFEKNLILFNVLNNGEMTRVEANGVSHFCGKRLAGVNFFVKQTLTFVRTEKIVVEEGSIIDIDDNSFVNIQSSTIILGNIQCREGSIAPIRVLREGNMIFGKQSGLHLIVDYSHWKGDVQYIVLSEQRSFNDETILPTLYLVNNKTKEITTGGRLFVECFGKWIVYKMSSNYVIKCNPTIEGYVEITSESNPLLIILFIFLLVGVGVLLVSKKYAWNTNRQNRFRDEIEINQTSPQTITVQSEE